MTQRSSSSSSTAQVSKLYSVPVFTGRHQTHLWQGDETLLKIAIIRRAHYQQTFFVQQQQQQHDALVKPGSDNELMAYLTSIIGRAEARKQYLSLDIFNDTIPPKLHINRLLSQTYLLRGRLQFKLGAVAAALADLKKAGQLIFEDCPVYEQLPDQLPNPDDSKLFPDFPEPERTNRRKRYMTFLLYRIEVLVSINDFTEAAKHLELVGTIPIGAYYLMFLKAKIHRGLNQYQVAEVFYVRTMEYLKSIPRLGKLVGEINLHRCVCFLSQKKISEAQASLNLYKGKSDFATMAMLRSVLFLLEDNMVEGFGFNLMARIGNFSIDLPLFFHTEDVSLKRCSGHVELKENLFKLGSLSNEALKQRLEQISSSISGSQIPNSSLEQQKGIILLLLGKHEEAAKVFQEGIKGRKFAQTSMIFWCGAKMKSGRYDQVIELLTRLLSKISLEDSSMLSFFHYLIGISAYMLLVGRDSAHDVMIRLAFTHLSKAWAGAFSLECGLLLGYLYQKLNQHEGAIQWLNLVLETRPTFCHALLARAISFMALNKEEEAYWDVNRVLQLHPTCVELAALRQSLSQAVFCKV